MMSFIPPRLRKPAAISLAGVVFAAAWLVRGGPLWWVSILAVILAAARAISQRVPRLVPGLRLISGHTRASRQTPAGASR